MAVWESTERPVVRVEAKRDDCFPLAGESNTSMGEGGRPVVDV